jgi:aspartyl-tRNA(Asn)/glutamyl-tRNA(Gln) amidotransferase subunit C
MSLSKADLAHLAALARIELSDAELEALAPQLAVILDSVASVAKVAEGDIPPTSHAVPMVNVFREDVRKDSFPPEAMLAGAPDAEDGRFRVPHILEEDA